MSSLLDATGKPIRDYGKELDEIKEVVEVLAHRINALGQVLKLAVDQARQQQEQLAQKE